MALLAAVLEVYKVLQAVFDVVGSVVKVVAAIGVVFNAYVVEAVIYKLFVAVFGN